MHFKIILSEFCNAETCCCKLIDIPKRIVSWKSDVKQYFKIYIKTPRKSGVVLQW